MATLHFLNVREGDCSIIQHNSGHVTVIDVNNARDLTPEESLCEHAMAHVAAAPGNFHQKAYPVNPIAYMNDRGINSVFRFILTHPDMDHMGGIKAFFEHFGPTNFWDTENTEKKEFEEGAPYNEDDWLFYQELRDSNVQSNPKRLTLYANSCGQYYNRDESGNSGADGLYVLAPTPELVQSANDSGNWNDSSYVILYRAGGGRVLFGGDSHDATWEYILKRHSKEVSDVDLLIAPHHGRKSERSYEFLDVLQPKLTFFGNANSEHLAYDAWRNRGLPFVTNNQANCMMVDVGNSPMRAYVTYKTFAEKCNPATFFSERLKAWHLCDIK